MQPRLKPQPIELRVFHAELHKKSKAMQCMFGRYEDSGRWCEDLSSSPTHPLCHMGNEKTVDIGYKNGRPSILNLMLAPSHKNHAL